MMQIQTRVGKLCEVVYTDPLSDDELTQFTLEIRSLVNAATRSLVFVCDWRRVEKFEKTTADAIVWIMRRDNPKIAFNAILVDPRNAPFREQVVRILREANNPRRQAFMTIHTLTRTVEALLTEEERTRLDQFLTESLRWSGV